MGCPARFAESQLSSGLFPWRQGSQHFLGERKPAFEVGMHLLHGTDERCLFPLFSFYVFLNQDKNICVWILLGAFNLLVEQSLGMGSPQEAGKG